LAIGGDPAPAVRAVEACRRAMADFEKGPDIAGLRAVKDRLLALGLWEPAMSVHAGLADDAARRGVLSEARGLYATAIGCAEAGGGQWLGMNILRRLAIAELKAGLPQQAVDNLRHALDRLKSVKLLNARLVEAECLDAMGDGYAAMGERTRAEECWKDAAARQEGLERGNAARKIRAKLSAS